MTGILGGIVGSMKGATAPKTAPTSLSAVPSSTSVAISFTAPSDNGGSAITNYEYSFNNSTWTALSPVDAISPITIGGLSGYTSYTVYLRAVNIFGSGPASSGVSFTTTAAPTTTINAVTNRTESRGTFNATISANGASTTVYFQYNTTNNFAAYTQVTAGTITGQSTAISYTQTGLSSSATVDSGGVTHYVRVVAVNSVGTTTSGVTSFNTWGIRQFNSQITSNFTVPTVSGVTPAALPYVLCIGGGGGGGRWGGGGGAGGLSVRTNWAFSGTSGYINWVMGGGGGGNDSGTGGSGTGTLFGGTNITVFGAGGGYGGGDQGYGGNVGGGDNAAYTGGAPYVKTGKGGYTNGGGGAGTDGYGGNATSGIAGSGGAGNGFWGTSGGAGGTILGASGYHGSPTAIGYGGNGSIYGSTGATSGATGVVYVQYWGP